MNKILPISLIAGSLIGFLSGCGTKSIPSVSYIAPSQSMPKGVEDHLSSYKSRVHITNRLPLTRAVTGRGLQQPIKGLNVVFIAPVDGPAIHQLESVWSTLKEKPTVVWTHTTPTIAKREWNALGFTTDPLPSAKTLYSENQVPSPDSYHAEKKGWNHLPGVLILSQLSQWTVFFESR